MAALHARCFTYPRPWGVDEFRSVTDGPGMFLLARPQGFLVGRTAADEAEILTLAVDPAVRRQGVGRGLVEAFVQEAASRGAERAYLEVAAGNVPARRLYDASGWTRIGLRRGYYEGSGIVMFHPLG
ncbi:MAG TPA: GNAT family N-acetyltransferase [Paracoccus sp. (in: a-proteobacteria)]|nr:GNAT family N-acetyltransferase [Paracoccus sp. (in: a-proteobacteria)]